MALLRLLGGAKLEDDDGLISGTVRRRHPIALLALLTSAPSCTMSRGKVVGLLWPEASERKARARLNSCLHRLRKRLGEEAVLSLVDDLQLNTELVRSDVGEFNRALEEGDDARAVELYAGPLLDGFQLGGSAAFERWVERERARLRKRYRQALKRLAEEAEEAGDPEAAARWWRERVDDDPYHARAAARLMEALAAAGNPAEALRVASVHARLLEERLGLEASEEVREVEERLINPSGGASSERRADERTDRGETGGAGEAKAAGAPPEKSGGGAAPSAAHPTTDRSGPGGPDSRHRRFWPAAAAVLLLASGAGVWMLVGTADTAETAGGGSSVAILPFRTVGTPDPSVLAEALHEDLLTRLSTVSDLAVISGTSARRYRESGLSLPAIADSLGARWVLEGGIVQESEGRIQVNVQLIDPETDTHLWAESFRRELTAGTLFDIQEEIARSTVAALEVRLTGSEEERLARMPTENLRAYRFYAQGRRHLGRRTEREGRAAIRAFRRAIAEDSSFALAWSGLADAVHLALKNGWTLPAVPLPGAEEAARRALELDPELAEAHASLANILMDPWGRRDAPAALRELREAVALNQGYAQAHHWLGYLELAFGDLDDALEHLTLAVELNPGLYPAWGTLAWAHLARDEPREALSWIERESEPARGLEEGSRSHVQSLRDRAIALYELDRLDAAARIARRGLSEDAAERPSFRMILIVVEGRRGETAAARAQLARMGEEKAPPVHLGIAHAAVGERDAAFDTWMREETVWPLGAVVLLRYWLPDVLEPVRRDQRYADLVRSIERKWKLEPDGRFGDLTS